MPGAPHYMTDCPCGVKAGILNQDLNVCLTHPDGEVTIESPTEAAAKNFRMAEQIYYTPDSQKNN